MKAVSWVCLLLFVIVLSVIWFGDWSPGHEAIVRPLLLTLPAFLALGVLAGLFSLLKKTRLAWLPLLLNVIASLVVFFVVYHRDS